MTANSFDWDDELPPETEDEVCRALLRALQRKQGFGLYFVQCSRAQGVKIVADLRRDLRQQRIDELHLREEVTTLFDQIAALWKQQPFDVLVVEGLQASLYAYEDTKRFSGWSSSDVYNYSWKGVPKILNHLNQQREHLRNDFPVRFVFLVPSFVVDYFIQRAADFLDWRSGLFRFPRNPSEVVQDAERFALGDYDKYLTLPPQERVRTILNLKAAFQEIETSHPCEKNWNQYSRSASQSENSTVQTQTDKLLDSPVLASELDQHKCSLLNELGLLYVAEQDYENALISWEKALTISPSYDIAWNNRGIALSALGRKEEAINSYDRALELNPKDDKAWYNRSNALSALERYEEAIHSYDKALELSPDKDAAWNNRGIVLSALGRYEEAITSYDKALKLKPSKDEAWNGRGNVFYALERYEEAIVSYDMALELNSSFHGAWNNRGMSLSALGRYEEAITSYDKAIQLLPDYANAYYNKARCYGLQRKVGLAIQNLQRAITLDSRYLKSAKTDPGFDSIRSDERFQRLVGD